MRYLATFLAATLPAPGLRWLAALVMVLLPVLVLATPIGAQAPRPSDPIPAPVVAGRSDCVVVVTFDTSGAVSGFMPVHGWAVHYGHRNAEGLIVPRAVTTSGVDMIELYRGEVPVSKGSGGHPRSDVANVVGLPGTHAGVLVDVDWAKEPIGVNTYYLHAHSECGWHVSQGRNLEVRPSSPTPVPATLALSISDEAVSVASATTLNSTLGFGLSGPTTCLRFDAFGNCIERSGVIGGFGALGFGIGDVDMDFAVTLGSASTAPVTVAYATHDGTAVDGYDYTATSGSLTFAPGETVKTITVRVHAQRFSGSTFGFGVDREFTVRLSNPTGAIIADGEGVGTISRFGSGSGVICPPGTFFDGFTCRSILPFTVTPTLGPSQTPVVLTSVVTATALPPTQTPAVIVATATAAVAAPTATSTSAPSATATPTTAPSATPEPTVQPSATPTEIPTPEPSPTPTETPTP